MRKYENVALFKSFIPQVESDNGFIDNYQGVGVVGLFLDYIEGKPQSISYYLDFMLGWNNIGNVTFHDTEDHTADPIESMRVFRSKVVAIRSHVKQSIRLCKTTGAVEYMKRVADIGAASSAYVMFHRTSSGSISWNLSDCRNKIHYGKSNNEDMLVFLERLSSAMDSVLKEYDKFVRHVNRSVKKLSLD